MVTAEPGYLVQVAPAGQHGEHLAHEPVSLTDSRSRASSGSLADHDEPACEPIKCSAVHSLERDMPDYDYSDALRQLRQLVLEHVRHNPGSCAPSDLDKCQHDDWFLARFLLRNHMKLDDALDMLKRALRYNNEYLASRMAPHDFPAEFYLLGGLFAHGHDRKGNKMLYMRIRCHRKTEIAPIVHAFIYYNIKRLDDEARGKGISIVLDCTGAGLANADTETLMFMISTLKNYFPKGLSYFLVHQLPWVLKPIWHLAKAWIPDEHRQLIKFSDPNTVNEYIEQDQLPDFMGGLVSEHQYKVVPDNCVSLEEATKLWGIDKRTLQNVLERFRDYLPEETVARIDNYLASSQAEPNSKLDLLATEQTLVHADRNES